MGGFPSQDAGHYADKGHNAQGFTGRGGGGGWGGGGGGGGIQNSQVILGLGSES